MDWKTDRIANVKPEEFYALIDRNREHIRKSFPVTLSGCTTLAKTVSFLKQAVDNEMFEDNYYFYLRSLDTNMLIGYVVIKNIDTDINKCELAYFVDKDFEGRGIITKAIASVLEICFGELKMNKVCICASPVNLASQKVAQKHGFKQEGTLRQEFKNGHGVFEDLVYFGLLRSDYYEK